MRGDKWYGLVNDDIADIPSRIERLRAAALRKVIPFVVMIVAGCVIIGVGRSSSVVGIGCFVAITGMVGMMTLATMCHTQLCLYRAIKEIRLGRV